MVKVRKPLKSLIFDSTRREREPTMPTIVGPRVLKAANEPQLAGPGRDGAEAASAQESAS